MIKNWNSIVSFIFSILFIFLFTSCSKESESLQPLQSTSLNTVPVINCDEHDLSACNYWEGGINIKIRNLSNYETCNIIYQADEFSHNFGTLQPGDTTCFIAQEIAYRFPVLVYFQISDTSIFRHARDFVGEERLEAGNYYFNLYSIYSNDRVIGGGKLINEKEDIRYMSQICNEEPKADCEIDPNKINIRIINETMFDFCNFNYENEQSQRYNYGNIAPGATTCYLPVENSGNYLNILNFFIGEHEKFKSLNSSWLTLDSGNYSLYIGTTSLELNDLITHLEKDE